MTRKVIVSVGADKTRQVDVAKVTHFQAADKCVSAYHQSGEMLLGSFERIKNLAVEFSDDFVQLSRELVVRKGLIRSLSDKVRDQHWRLASVEGIGDQIRVTRPYVEGAAKAAFDNMDAATVTAPMDDEPPSAERSYVLGGNARESCFSKNPPAHLSREHRSWWLAGWNDRDIERSDRIERAIR